MINSMLSASIGNIKQIYIIIVCLVIVIYSSLAQDPVIIKLTRPPLNKLGASDLWKLDITNTTREDVAIYLTGTATEEKDGLIVEGKSKVFTVKPGKKTFGYNDFKEGDVNWKNKTYQEAILRTGNVKSGTYNICVTAFYENGSVADNEQCITQVIENVTASTIILISPPPEGEVDAKTGITFMWSGIGVKGSYTLTIVELKGSQSREEAINNNPKVVVAGSNSVSGYSLSPVEISKLEAGKKYAWRVASGDVQSEIFTFIAAKINSAGNDKIILFPDDVPVVIDRKLNSLIHGREITEDVTLYDYDGTLKDDDKIYILQPSWSGAGSRDKQAGEKLNTNKINAEYIILQSPEGELYALPVLVLFDYDPVLGFAEACNKCPTTYDNKRGCSGSFCFCLLSADSISKPKPVNLTLANGGQGVEVVRILYPSQIENAGEVVVAFECTIPRSQNTFGDLLKIGDGKMPWWCCNRTDRRCCHSGKSRGNINIITPDTYGVVQKVHPERIVYDFEKNLLGAAEKNVNGKINIYLDETGLLGLYKTQKDTTGAGRDEFISSVKTYLETGNSPKMLNKCWACWTVLCNNTNHPPGCGWTECGWVNCQPHVLEVSGRFSHPDIIIYDAEKNLAAMSIKNKDGVTKIFINEEKLLLLAKEYIQSLNITPQEFIKAFDKNLREGNMNEIKWGIIRTNNGTTTESNPDTGCITVYCNNPNHPPGCGWLECNP